MCFVLWKSLLSQFNLTNLSSHVAIIWSDAHSISNFVSQTTAITLPFRSSFYVNLVSSMNYTHSNCPIGSDKVINFFFINALYVRWDFTGFRTWKKVDNLLLTEMKKDVGKWDGNIKLHSRLCYWRSHIARFFCLLLPPLLKSSLLLAPLDVFNYK
jgi:hypothetical protein